MRVVKRRIAAGRGSNRQAVLVEAAHWQVCEVFLWQQEGERLTLPKLWKRGRKLGAATQGQWRGGAW